MCVKRFAIYRLTLIWRARAKTSQALTPKNRCHIEQINTFHPITPSAQRVFFLRAIFKTWWGSGVKELRESVCRSPTWGFPSLVRRRKTKEVIYAFISSYVSLTRSLSLYSLYYFVYVILHGYMGSTFRVLRPCWCDMTGVDHPLAIPLDDAPRIWRLIPQFSCPIWVWLVLLLENGAIKSLPRRTSTSIL